MGASTESNRDGDFGRMTAIIAFCTLTELTDDGRTAHFEVGEFLEFGDGSRVIVHDGEYGWTEGGRGLDEATDPREIIFSRDRLSSTARLVVGPEEPEGDDHAAIQEDIRWRWLSDRAAEKGVTVSAAALRSLPYRVEFDPQTEQLLA